MSLLILDDVHHPDVAGILLPAEVKILAVRGQTDRNWPPSLAFEVGDWPLDPFIRADDPQVPFPLPESTEVNRLSVL